jgi:hypothetical protein
MSVEAHPQRRPEPTELETVVNWRLIGAAAAAAVVLLVVPVTAALLLGPAAPRPKEAPAAPPVALAPQVPQFVLPARSYQPPPPAITVVTFRPPARQELSPAPAASIRKEVAPPRPASAPPTATPVVTAPAPTQRPGFRRWNVVSDYYLLERLTLAPEVDLRANEETVSKLQAAVNKAKKASGAAAPPVEPLPGLLAQRPDLSGLPFRMGADCRAPAKALRTMGAVSAELRRAVAKPDQREAPSLSQFQGYRRAQALVDHVKRNRAWHTDDGASTVAQILQPEIVFARREAVKWLSDINGPRAGAALANLAVFDLSAEVREDAVSALGKRPRAEYRDALLRGLRYPWPPAADHAAEALVELRDVSAVPALTALLDQPDPAAPTRKDGKWVVSEMVRVNHMRNCYLCHAPALDVKDPIPGLVPTPGQELPVVYYQRGRGPFVRADVTYLRQDFSLMQRVEKPNKWPAWQRFDFLVRTRELPAKEAAALDKGPLHPRWMIYPQREAVLFALRELTGEDLGKSSADWDRFLLGPWLEHEL